MLMFALAIVFTLLVAYIIYVLLPSSNGEHGSNLFDAFVDASSSEENSGNISRCHIYNTTHNSGQAVNKNFTKL